MKSVISRRCIRVEGLRFARSNVVKREKFRPCNPWRHTGWGERRGADNEMLKKWEHMDSLSWLDCRKSTDAFDKSHSHLMYPLPLPYSSLTVIFDSRFGPKISLRRFCWVSSFSRHSSQRANRLNIFIFRPTFDFVLVLRYPARPSSPMGPSSPINFFISCIDLNRSVTSVFTLVQPL